MSKEQSEGNQKLVIAECVEIFIRDGIVHVVYLDGAEVGLEINRESHLAYLKITGGMKMPFLFYNTGSFWISKDAREHARKIEAKQPFLAVACVASNLGIRLMADFYGKFYKPEIPYKVFVNEEEAVTWLKQFGDQ